MKVIFLDCDGVINSLASFLISESVHKSSRANLDKVDPIAVGLIDRLCEETDAKIVLSSAWRTTRGTEAECLKRSKTTLRRAGAGCLANRMIGTTGEYNGDSTYRRGMEISSWLNHWHKENRGGMIERYVIIDDDSDFLPEQRPWFVQTRFAHGFRMREYVEALMLLDPTHKDCSYWKAL